MSSSYTYVQPEPPESAAAASSPASPKELQGFVVTGTHLLRCGCCLCCCTGLLGVIIFIAGWAIMSKTIGSMEQDPNITPPEFPRCNSCAGCREGCKSDEELEACIEPCFNLTLVHSWEAFNKKHGFKLVFFPSRPGPNGEPPVNVSAWWMPAPSSDGKTPPRVVALHGMASNNNHCGVQMTCFLLRTMGFSCLAPSVRDFGLSGPSTHPNVVTWGYDYHLDLLGAWDYAVADPDDLLGGTLEEDQVGIMGFSKGGYGAAIAMGLEPRISAAWIDSAPLHGLRGVVHDYAKQYVGDFIGGLLAEPILWAAHWWSGNTVGTFDAFKLLSEQCPRQRHLMLSQSSVDDVVPVQETQATATTMSGMFECYLVSQYSPPEYCNGAKHHQEMWEFPDDTRLELCSFWSGAFGRDTALCNLDSLPKYQIWSPFGELPPGSPGLMTPLSI